MIDPNEFFANFHWNASDMLLELQRQGFVPQHFLEVIEIIHRLHIVWQFDNNIFTRRDDLRRKNLDEARALIQDLLHIPNSVLLQDWITHEFRDVENEYYLQMVMYAYGFDEPPPVIRPITGVDAVITRFEYSGRNPETHLTDATKRAIIAAARRLQGDRRYKGMAGDRLTCYFHAYSYYQHKWHVSYTICNWSEGERSPGSSPHTVDSGQINNITRQETVDAKDYRDLIADWGTHR